MAKKKKILLIIFIYILPLLLLLNCKKEKKNEDAIKKDVELSGTVKIGLNYPKTGPYEVSKSSG